MFGRFFGRYFGAAAARAAASAEDALPDVLPDVSPDAPNAAWFRPREDSNARIHRQNQAVILAIVQAAASGVFR